MNHLRFMLLIADGVRTAPDNSSVEFHINPAAKFSDGKAITADDVVWTFNTLLKQGHPFYRSYYADVKDVQILDAKKQIVRFAFKTKTNRELPLILAQLPVLPKHSYTDAKAPKDFARTTLEAPIGSGAYKVGQIVPGRTISYARDSRLVGQRFARQSRPLQFQHCQL